ncbi:hypothetical protein AAYQ19_20595 [Flavobacterium sp. D4]
MQKSIGIMVRPFLCLKKEYKKVQPLAHITISLVMRYGTMAIAKALQQLHEKVVRLLLVARPR